MFPLMHHPRKITPLSFGKAAGYFMKPTIIVRRKKKKDEVTATLIIGVLSSVAIAMFLAVGLIKLFTR
jgi:hypothetical protein